MVVLSKWRPHFKIGFTFDRYGSTIQVFYFQISGLEPKRQQPQIHNNMGHRQTISNAQNRVKKLPPVPRRETTNPKGTEEKHPEQEVGTF